MELILFLSIPFTLIGVLIYILVKRNKAYKVAGVKTDWKAIIIFIIIILIFSIIRGTIRNNSVEEIKKEIISSPSQTQ